MNASSVGHFQAGRRSQGHARGLPRTGRRKTPTSTPSGSSRCSSSKRIARALSAGHDLTPQRSVGLGNQMATWFPGDGVRDPANLDAPLDPRPPTGVYGRSLPSFSPPGISSLTTAIVSLGITGVCMKPQTPHPRAPGPRNDAVPHHVRSSVLAGVRFSGRGGRSPSRPDRCQSSRRACALNCGSVSTNRVAMPGERGCRG
jgi:hypothetical protein